MTYLATAAAECTAAQQQRLTVNSYYVTIFWGQKWKWGEPARHLCWTDYFGPLPSSKWQHFVLNGLDPYLG